jgi:hypothetical protein
MLRSISLNCPDIPVESIIAQKIRIG